jgi:hypothetical protein
MSEPAKISVQQITHRRVAPVSHDAIHWPDIPIDILKLVIEHSPRGVLPTWCRVSKFCNGCAMRVLYREVNVDLVQAPQYSSHVAKQLLLRLVKGAGRYCRSFKLEVGKDFYETDEGGPPDAAFLMDAMISGLGMSIDVRSKGLS